MNDQPTCATCGKPIRPREGGWLHVSKDDHLDCPGVARPAEQIGCGVVLGLPEDAVKESSSPGKYQLQFAAWPGVTKVRHNMCTKDVVVHAYYQGVEELRAKISIESDSEVIVVCKHPIDRVVVIA